MIEERNGVITFSERTEGPYRILTAETDLWVLERPDDSVNMAAFKCPPPAVGINWEIYIETPRSVWFPAVTASFRGITARRTTMRVSWIESHFFMLIDDSPARRRTMARCKFLTVLLDLYATRPWLYPGLISRIRELGGDEREIYDARFVFACGDDFICRVPRLLEKCECEPWKYRELRGYLRKLKYGVKE